ncbi:hypothetical protein [Actinomycetospora corticicola]|uniref:Secreted protein n=1 Tax=Actinomycetospora corticicola TaxID=663602 RepID=A0A7Y9J722_9PSEU|nr:hypothetical protein [Actinomycetospora corticicola]NYD37581.1 hypothetical protein [Actinomycetospora corticicola]
MSMLRKVVVSTAIVGAGLGSLAGIASAHESGHAASGCSNAIKASSENGAGRTLGDTTGGDQDLSGSNVCDILNGNEILSGNNIATLAGTIVNGDTRTETSDRTSTTTITETLTGLLGL